ncbi:MAG: hypothetical protein ACR2NR_04215 [Solirubrobacteraceae bacterium]
MDTFAIAVFGCLAALVLWVWLLGRNAPGDGLQQLGLRTPREIVEDREALEAEDLTQMLEAHNARRRRRGKPEVTVEDLELQVAADFNDQQRRREALLADRDLDQLLEATNARRRARGLPERTRAEVKQEYGSGASTGSAPGR